MRGGRTAAILLAVALLVGDVIAESPTAPAARPLSTERLLADGGPWGKDTAGRTPSERWADRLDALAPLGRSAPIAGAELLGADFASAEGRLTADGLLAPTDPLLTRARQWSLASEWSFHPETLGAAPTGEPQLPWDTIRLLVDSLVSNGLARESDDELRAALRCARLAWESTLFPEDELEALRLMEGPLLAMEERALARGEAMTAATALAAMESVAGQRSNLRFQRWHVVALSTRVREGWFGPKLADVTPTRARSLAQVLDHRRQWGESRASLADHLGWLWIVARTGRSATGREGRALLAREAEVDDPALAALAAWWLEQPWDDGALVAGPGFLDVEDIDELTRWAHGAGWRERRTVVIDFIEATPLGEAEGDAGPWLHGFVADHRSRWAELGLESLPQYAPSMERIQPLAADHPVLAEAAAELEKSRCRLPRGELESAESLRLAVFVRTLMKTWMTRIDSALAEGRVHDARRDLLLARRVARLVREDERFSDTMWTNTTQPLLLFETRVALAAKDEAGFLDAHRRWRFHRVNELQSRSAGRVVTVRYALRHGSPVEAFFKQPRVSDLRLDWIFAMTEPEFGEWRESAAYALWLLSHEGAPAQRERCQARLEELAEDDDAELAAKVTVWLDEEPTNDQVRGFEWDTFGVGLLERSLIPESWYR